MFSPARSNRSKNSRSLPRRRFAIEATASAALSPGSPARSSLRSIGVDVGAHEKIQRRFLLRNATGVELRGGPVSYSAADARAQVLRDVAEATDQLALALASLGEAYEELDEQTADRL